MTGTTHSHMREVLPVLVLDSKENGPLQCPSYVSYALKKEPKRQFTAVYGSIPINTATRTTGLPIAERPTESDALLGGGYQHSGHSETESDSDGSVANISSSSSLQSILRIPSGDFSCRSPRKQVSVEFALDIDDEDEAHNAKRRLHGSCASRCMPRRLTIEEKAALYQVRPDLELVPTVLLLSELEEMRRRRQRKLMFSILGASLILFMMIVFYYLVSQM
ncbi:hypothetical protein PsorP6_008826 [Peronosclerospora sorghi]|uniref:Uncharacterized protein n=1 Tax=Peronosclerospora sorghi TaxID=230839 RepID=A0ACC0VZX0_9STRA|nr:hypothetical protein PsorP6_008826 [Peronosclerospora sorghi]